MLDRNDTRQIHYYQPGFGTYTTSIWMSDKTRGNAVARWFSNAKDAAAGTTFDEHVMDGYRFLMRFYYPADSIYIFGFSRGAYVARMLAEMLDHIGLLEAGNEGKVRYVWTVFSRWAKYSNSMGADQTQKDDLYRYMKALRETFCRPVSQIRFLGLFDTVNSIPRFETSRNRFMFPFTAKTSARVIRHAVGIDERRAKFREDLLSDPNPMARSARLGQKDQRGGARPGVNGRPKQGAAAGEAAYRPDPRLHRKPMNASSDGRMRTEETRNMAPLQYPDADSTIPASTSTAVAGPPSAAPEAPHETDKLSPEESGDVTQDIEEVWFPGCHGDIGGGLSMGEGEDFALSHVPLVWMVHEAQCAGLRFDPNKLKQFNCFDDSTSNSDLGRYPEAAARVRAEHGETGKRSEFKHALWSASTNSQLHDFLQYGRGMSWPAVLSWRMVEYLPFRRMGLRNDGSWKRVRWPLPLGERRDVPKGATVHGSAIRRMEANPGYRPLNLIQGGKGSKKAKGHGIGKWKVYAHPGCPVRETYHRTEAVEQD